MKKRIKMCQNQLHKTTETILYHLKMIQKASITYGKGKLA